MDRNGKMIVEVLGEPASISPSDLYQKKFRRSFRGARMSDVTTFLEEVGDELERVVDENRRLRAQVRELLAQLDHFRSIETTLRNAVVSTEKFREQVGEEARAEAEKTVMEARAEAEKTVADARAESETVLAQAGEEKRRIEEEIDQLTEQRERFKRKLVELLRVHLNLLDSAEAHAGEPAAEADDA